MEAREGAAFVDATQKSCKGVIAALEGVMPELGAGCTVTVAVLGVPDKIDVYAWAKRKGHLVKCEEHKGMVYELSIVKCGMPQL